MDFKDLDQKELLAFVGLMELVLIADFDITEEESHILESIIEKLGQDNYRTLLLNYKQTFSSIERFKVYLLSIERQEARNFIYGVLFEIAQADYVHHLESKILDWLAEAWDVDIKFNKITSANKAINE